MLVGGAPLDSLTVPAPWVDPALERCDPALMRLVAGRCRAAAHALDALFQTTATATAALGAAWHGKGAAAFANTAGTLNAHLETAAQALIGTADALNRLADAVEQARSLAQVASDRWTQARARLAWAVSSYDDARNHALALLGPHATPAELEATVPFEWYASVADEAVAEARAAADLAERANAEAKAAFSEAAFAFDAITAQAPSVQNALFEARLHAFGTEMKAMEFDFVAESVAGSLSVEPLEPDDSDGEDAPLVEEPADLSTSLPEEEADGATASVDGSRLGELVAEIGNSRLVIDAAEAEQAALGDPVGDGPTILDPSRPLAATGPLSYLAPPGSESEGAIPGEPPPTPPPEIPRVPDGWPTPPANVIHNFSGPLEPTALVGGVTYYRAVGAGSLPDGSWWSPVPPTPEDRPALAIAGHWNSMTGVVEFTPAEGVSIPAWKGIAAPQVVPTSDGEPGYLPGGAEQIWVPRGALTSENGTFTIRPAFSGK